MSRMKLLGITAVGFLSLSLARPDRATADSAPAVTSDAAPAAAESQGTAPSAPVPPTSDDASLSSPISHEAPANPNALMRFDCDHDDEAGTWCCFTFFGYADCTFPR